MATYKEKALASGQRVWDAHVRIAGAKSEQRRFPSRSEAEIWADRREGEIRESLRRGADLNSKSFLKEKFRYAIDQFMARSDDAEKYRHVLTVVRKHFPDVSFGELRPSLVKGYVTQMMKTHTIRGRVYKGNTMATHIAALRAVYKWRAFEYDIDLKPSVFTRAFLPKGYDEKRDRRLLAEEWDRLKVEFARRGRRGQVWQLLVGLALETAARQQELFLAKWDDFDLNRRVWKIHASHTKCKTERSVPLSRAAVAILERLGNLCGCDPRPFSSLTSLMTIRTEWRLITAAAGVVDFRFHDLRHEAISRLVLSQRRLTVFEIMKFVGHSSTIMLSRYANLRGDELAERMD